MFNSLLRPLLFLLALATAGLARGQTGTDGLYATTDNNYRIDVKFEPGKLTVIEPNKKSVYVQEGSSGVYAFTNPNNGISYLLEVTDGGKGLKAYKPGAADRATPLTLIKAASPAAVAESAAPAAGVVKIPVLNPASLHPGLTELWGAQKIEGVKLAGRYLAHGETRPYAELNADGTGIFEMHGAPKPEYIYQIKWWVQANRDGTLVKKDHELAEEYALIVEYDRPYQGNRFDRLQLVVQKGPAGEIFILDRSKPKS